MNPPTYVSTFCNFPHRLDTGRPVGHECYILPPAMLRAELAGDYDGAAEILSAAGRDPLNGGPNLPVVRGRAAAWAVKP